MTWDDILRLQRGRSVDAFRRGDVPSVKKHMRQLELLLKFGGAADLLGPERESAA